MLTAGHWYVGNWRGQVWLLRHPPNINPSFVRTTMYLGLSGPRPVALVKALVFESASTWDEKHNMPSALWSRPYIIVNFGEGVALKSGGGFGVEAVRLPETIPALKRVGVVFWCVGVPHWFLVGITGAWPALVVRRWVSKALAARRRGAGRCPGCGYDLRATPQRCPECGWTAQVALTR